MERNAVIAAMITTMVGIFAGYILDNFLKMDKALVACSVFFIIMISVIMILLSCYDTVKKELTEEKEYYEFENHAKGLVVEKYKRSVTLGKYDPDNGFKEPSSIWVTFDLRNPSGDNIDHYIFQIMTEQNSNIDLIKIELDGKCPSYKFNKIDDNNYILDVELLMRERGESKHLAINYESTSFKMNELLINDNAGIFTNYETKFAEIQIKLSETLKKDNFVLTLDTGRTDNFEITDRSNNSQDNYLTLLKKKRELPFIEKNSIILKIANPVICRSYRLYFRVAKKNVERR